MIFEAPEQTPMCSSVYSERQETQGNYNFDKQIIRKTNGNVVELICSLWKPWISERCVQFSFYKIPTTTFKEAFQIKSNHKKKNVYFSKPFRYKVSSSGYKTIYVLWSGKINFCCCCCCCYCCCCELFFI